MAAVYERAVLVDAAAGAEGDVWASIARSYSAFTSPLVPCREDIAVYEHAVASHAATIHASGLDAVMLGVTPAMALMRWPAGSRILAVELSPEVIRALWPGDVPGVREAKCASWFDIPKARQSCDVVIGDGSLIACRFPGEVRTLARSLSELLKAGGLLALRCYVRPDKPGTVEDVFDALFGPVGMNVDCFKMRLWLAMQRSPEQGVAVRDAARVLARYRLDARAMKERLGWSSAVIEPFSKWPTSEAIYSFPPLDGLRAVLGEYFAEVSVTFPSYPLGHCCPMLVMRSGRPALAQGVP